MDKIRALAFAAFMGVNALANASVIVVGQSLSNAKLFNNFEDVSVGQLEAPASYSQGGITVTQIGQYGNHYAYGGNGVVSTGYMPLGFNGEHSWYPAGGDWGYTRIKATNGVRLSDLSLLTSNGWFGTTEDVYLNYKVLLDGVVTLSGHLLQNKTTVTPVMFTGSVFDEILLSATFVVPGEPTVRKCCSGNAQALAIDDVSATPISIPPTSFLLLAGGLALMTIRRNTSRTTSSNSWNCVQRISLRRDS